MSAHGTSVLGGRVCAHVELVQLSECSVSRDRSHDATDRRGSRLSAGCRIVDPRCCFCPTPAGNNPGTQLIVVIMVEAAEMVSGSADHG